MKVKSLSCARLLTTPWTAAYQASPSMRFFRQDWHGLPLPSPAKSVSVQFSHSVVSDSLRPHESQHARPPCPSPTPGVHSDSRPSSQGCHPTISSSVVPFSSCPQSLPASESFPMSLTETAVKSLNAGETNIYLIGQKVAGCLQSMQRIGTKCCVSSDEKPCCRK